MVDLSLAANEGMGRHIWRHSEEKNRLLESVSSVSM